MDPLLHQSEHKRLEDLAATGIMDTLPEAAYDDISILASYICDTPIAYISFIDDKRQWYKSSINVPITETSIEDALCANTLHGTELVHVSDLTQDARYRENPFVKSEMGIRFYAGYPLINSEGSALGTLCVIDYKVRELDERQRFALSALGRQVITQLELRRNLNTTASQAAHDALTGLPNRLLLTERLAQACRKAVTSKGQCALLFIDLDHFKAVNDTHGHSAGDLVLVEVASRLRSILRKGDTVGRYGGDEFLVVLEGIKTIADVEVIMESITSVLEVPIAHKSQLVRIGASIGYSIFPLHAKTSDELIQHADTRLYKAKRTRQASTHAKS
jgi:diguanylate cyclase (GGDEF)-like protein